MQLALLLGGYIAATLTERLGKQVVVDNRPGAAGMIGNDLAAKATPGGTAPVQSRGYTEWQYRRQTRTLRGDQEARQGRAPR